MALGAGLVVASLPAAGAGTADGQEHDRHDEHETGPPVLGHRAGPRGLALGNSFWTASRDDLAIFHHPALLGGSAFGVEYAHFGEGSNFMAASASGGWLGGTAGIGLSFLDSGHGRPEYRDGLERHEERERRGAGGGHREREGREHGRDVAELGSSFALAVGFATELLGLRVGGAAKAVGQNSANGRHATAALDLGAAAEAGPVALALSVQNLGPALEADANKLPLPTRLVLGAGTDREPVGPFDVGVAVHAAVERAGGFSAGGGIEAAWWPVAGRVFVARAGVVGGGREQETALTFGAGFQGDRIRLDYAYGKAGRHDRRHAASIAFR